MGKIKKQQRQKQQRQKQQHKQQNERKITVTENGECPHCGSTDISYNQSNGKLRCNFCRQEFEPIASDKIIDDASTLRGENINIGASDIDTNQPDLLTLKCPHCGAEVIVNTANTTSARCHWCRSYLSINDAIPNGAVPDMILPFKVNKIEAQELIGAFVSDRLFFAKSRFKREFTADNIIGVYFPYMLVDANIHAQLNGKGEKDTFNIDKTFVIDAQEYSVKREYDVAINGLSIESAKEHLNNRSSYKTNNIINSIMPFDTENSLKFDSNYLRGFNSEKRDLNISQLKPIVNNQIADICRLAAVPSLSQYDRGVCWEEEKYDYKGINWTAVYLPVWLYSYMDRKKKIHYIAVNARTKETSGSIPINMAKLIFISLLVELGCLIFVPFVPIELAIIILLVIGPGVFITYYSDYRNKEVRHYHEKETSSKISNMKCTDEKGEIRERVSVKIKNENYKNVSGYTTKKANFFDDIASGAKQ